MICIACHAVTDGNDGPQCGGCRSWGTLRLHTPSAGRAMSPEDTILAFQRAPAPEAPLPMPVSIPRPRPTPVETPARPRSVPVSLTDVPESTYARYQSGLAPFDDVLGGGLVVGSALAIVAPPGSGKSQLALQVLAGIGEAALYATAEEMIDRVAATARRIGADVPSTMIVRETNVDTIIEHVRERRVRVLVVDSVQMTYCPDIKGSPGSPMQLTESARRLVALQEEGVTVCLISQVTTDGDAKGGTFLLHIVDAIVELIETRPPYRILRCIGKNRGGAAHVVARLEMTTAGLVPAAEPEPEPEDDAPHGRLGAIGAELGDSADGELPDTIANRLLRAAVRLADVADAEKDADAVGGNPLDSLQRFGLAADELHEAAKTFAHGIPERDRRRLGA
jgi:predicted ATP-dependent serine protease